MEKSLENALEKIRKVLEKRPEVLAAYLYGSHAKGYARERSDVDIAVTFVSDFNPEDPIKHALELGDNVNKAVADFRVNRVNVIPAEAMSYPLKHNAVVFGRVVYSRDDLLRAERQLELWAEYEDLKKFYEIKAKYVVEAEKRLKTNE